MLVVNDGLIAILAFVALAAFVAWLVSRDA